QSSSNYFITNMGAKDSFHIQFDGGHKTKIHYDPTSSVKMHNSAWDVNIDMICVIRNNNFRPDVGIWFWTLT
ncbi:4898_t:CDS:2, partial [Diversispora eburnea]